MSNKHTRTPYPERPEHGSVPADRGAVRDARAVSVDPAPVDPAPLDPSTADPVETGAMAAEVELAMSDLVGDQNGEIVFYNDSGLRRLAIATDAVVVADGRAGAHRTAAGEDVSGFGFMRFDNGLTLYYRTGLDVVVRGVR